MLVNHDPLSAVPLGPSQDLALSGYGMQGLSDYQLDGLLGLSDDQLEGWSMGALLGALGRTTAAERQAAAAAKKATADATKAAVATAAAAKKAAAAEARGQKQAAAAAKKEQAKAAAATKKAAAVAKQEIAKAQKAEKAKEKVATAAAKKQAAAQKKAEKKAAKLAGKNINVDAKDAGKVAALDAIAKEMQSKFASINAQAKAAKTPAQKQAAKQAAINLMTEVQSHMGTQAPKVTIPTAKGRKALKGLGRWLGSLSQSADVIPAGYEGGTDAYAAPTDDYAAQPTIPGAYAASPYAPASSVDTGIAPMGMTMMPPPTTTQMPPQCIKNPTKMQCVMLQMSQDSQQQTMFMMQMMMQMMNQLMQLIAGLGATGAAAGGQCAAGYAFDPNSGQCVPTGVMTGGGVSPYGVTPQFDQYGNAISPYGQSPYGQVPGVPIGPGYGGGNVEQIPAGFDSGGATGDMFTDSGAAIPQDVLAPGAPPAGGMYAQATAPSAPNIISSDTLPVGAEAGEDTYGGGGDIVGQVAQAQTGAQMPGMYMTEGGTLSPGPMPSQPMPSFATMAPEQQGAMISTEGGPAAFPEEAPVAAAFPAASMPPSGMPEDAGEFPQVAVQPPAGADQNIYDNLMLPAQPQAPIVAEAAMESESLDRENV